MKPSLFRVFIVLLILLEIVWFVSPQFGSTMRESYRHRERLAVDAPDKDLVSSGDRGDQLVDRHQDPRENIRHQFRGRLIERGRQRLFGLHDREPARISSAKAHFGPGAHVAEQFLLERLEAPAERAVQDRAELVAIELLNKGNGRQAGYLPTVFSKRTKRCRNC